MAVASTVAATYGELSNVFTRMYRFSHALSILGWDEMVNMPPGGVEGRGSAKAEIELLLHELLTNEATGKKIQHVTDAIKSAGADKVGLSNEQLANFREMRRMYDSETKLPADHVEAVSKAVSQSQSIWIQSRPKNDWNAFAPEFKKMVELKRREGQLLATGTSLTPYEALVDKYEPGVTLDMLDRVFSDVKSWLPGLLKDILAKQETISQPIIPEGPFPVDCQRDLGVEVMKTLLKFDFNRGRVDVSKHPFCGGVPEDVRITTRYNEKTFDQSLMGIIHETGHARYEQNRPAEWLSQPVSAARSMGIHESQSLFFEMQIARSGPFMKQLSPLLKRFFPDLAKADPEAYSVENIHRLYTRVRPGLIRVDADEVCYPLHVILRYEIESALVEGRMEVDDVPKVWAAKMQEYLGLDTTGDFKDGPMQDIHWAIGLFGYFPTYTLGAMYAAQLMAAMRRDIGDAQVDGAIAEAKMEPLFDWLKAKVWSKGSFLPTGEALIQAATGEGLNAKYYREHLTNRYYTSR
jgi:carboxypeptidase Taq